MPCQNRYGCRCKKYQKKEDYRQALRKYPNLDNPLQNWECNEEEEKTCKQFEAVPPRMTQEEFKKEHDIILANVPKEFVSTFSGMAWDRGHSAGFEEVIGILRDLVNEMKLPLAQFEARIRKEAFSAGQICGCKK